MTLEWYKQRYPEEYNAAITEFNEWAESQGLDPYLDEEMQLKKHHDEVLAMDADSLTITGKNFQEVTRSLGDFNPFANRDLARAERIARENPPKEGILISSNPLPVQVEIPINRLEEVSKEYEIIPIYVTGSADPICFVKGQKKPTKGMAAEEYYEYMKTRKWEPQHQESDYTKQTRNAELHKQWQELEEQRTEKALRQSICKDL